MTQEEFTKLVESLKAQGMSEEDILGTLLEMFKDGKVSGDDLEQLAGSLGYELTEEFKKSMSEEGAPASEEITEEEVEDAQEVEPGEETSEEESSEEETEEETDEEESEESDEEDEEDEKKEARELYGLDK